MKRKPRGVSLTPLGECPVARRSAALRTVGDTRGRKRIVSLTYSILQCMGCDNIRFHATDWDTSLLDKDGHPIAGLVFRAEPFLVERRAVRDLEKLAVVGPVYHEAILAFNASARVLAGAGLRAVVEAICQHNAIHDRGLDKKISRLTSMGILTESQAAALHELRYIGNAALHEQSTPSYEQLIFGNLPALAWV